MSRPLTLVRPSGDPPPRTIEVEVNATDPPVHRRALRGIARYIGAPHVRNAPEPLRHAVDLTLVERLLAYATRTLVQLRENLPVMIRRPNAWRYAASA